MKFLVDFLTGLPQPVFVRDTVIPFLVEHNILTSKSVLDNLHTILFTTLFYHIVYLIGAYIVFPPLSRCKITYDENHAKTEEIKKHIHDTREKKIKHLSIQASIHFISFLQTLVVLYLSFVFFLNPEISGKESYPDSDSRIFGEVRETQLVCLFGLGYFIWDAYISACHSTLAFTIHGIVSTGAYYIGMKPYLQYYAPVFLMFELSNPFLNIRWYGLKFFPSDNKISEIILLLNNLILMLIFFFVRVLWGWYQTYMLITDFWTVRNDPRFILIDTIIVVTCNLTIDVLNVIWFTLMLKTAIKVITGSKDKKKPSKEKKTN